MDNFNFNLFKYFYYVVLYNGVTNASKNLSVAQPSLSLSIKKLESELNVTLIDRSSYQFKLTDEGQKLFEVIKPAIESIEDNINFKPDEKKYLEINIAINQCYAKVILGSFIKIFRNRYPKIKINIDLYSVLDNDKINNKDYDIVIDNKVNFKHLEDVTIETLCSLQNYFVCGTDLFVEYKDVKSIKEFGVFPFISYKPSLKTGKFKELCYQNNVKFLEIISTNESDLYFDLVKENVGLGFSNELLLREYISDKSIHKILISEDIFKDVLSILYTKESDIINNFVDMLKEYVKEEIK